jgi:predicted nucleic acid-binding protein
MKYLLDTCVLSELAKSTPNIHIQNWFEARKTHELCTSAITWAELQRGVARLPQSKRQTELALWLQKLEAGFEDRILPFNKNAAQVWAQMTVNAETQGKPIAAFDSMIAATARAYNCKFVTRNVRDFAHAGIDIINPWQDDQ